MGGSPYPDPLLCPVGHFDGTRDASAPADRLRAVRRAAEAFREEMLAGPAVGFYASTDLQRVPYPTAYGLRDAARVATPMLHILNRLFVVQWQGPDKVWTLLVSPSDLEGNRETPFFKRLADRIPLRAVLEPVFAPIAETVEQALARLGIAFEQVDYITYDHLHTQDLRKWLGDGRRPGLFPNAKLLIMRQEWTSTRSLLPLQRPWYCPDGTAGVPDERVILLDHDVMLGGGVALVRTPGHTEGNHSIVVHTPEGLMVTSENGISPDAYAPAESRIPGLRRYARDGMEVVLNANTLECSIDQYISMVQEKTIAGPAPRNEAFFNVVPSSELTPYWLFPGVRPSFCFGPLRFGDPLRALAGDARARVA